jgi:hypothetical protein
VQVINEGIDDLYATSSVPKPNGQGESDDHAGDG